MEEKTSIDNNSTKSNGTILPFNLPTILGESGSGVLRLPFKLPTRLGGNIGSLRLPFKLPTRLGSGGTKKYIKMPVQVVCEFVVENKTLKIPITEQSSSSFVKIPVKEKGWVFYGLIMEENIVKEMNSQLTLTEDVKARILAEYQMINGKDVKVEWYGEEVRAVETYMKMSLEDEYTKIGTYPWDVGEAIITLGTGEFDLMLKGVGETGFSDKFTLGEPTFAEVELIPIITKNEKLHQIAVEYISEYRMKINY